MAKTISPIGVRTLRARLSFYLRAVARGETVTVGDRRHRPIARLVPVRQSADHEMLDRLASQGVVHRGVGKPGTAAPVRPNRGGRLVSEIVVADRG